MVDLDKLAKTSQYAFGIVFEAKVRAMILMLRENMKLSDKEIKEVIAAEVEKALKAET
jgi:hypothetical protein